MPELPLSPGKPGRHGAPVSRRAVLVSWLLGLSWLGGCIAAFFIGFGVAGAAVAPAHAAQVGVRQSSLGPALVGASAMILVFIAGAQISILRDRRRHPMASYHALHWRRDLPPSLALRHNARVALISIPIAALGLWLTHLYG
jgi:hypothetical protein